MMVKVAVAVEPPKQCGMTLCMKIFPLKNNALNAKNLSFIFYILVVLPIFFSIVYLSLDSWWEICQIPMVTRHLSLQ